MPNNPSSFQSGSDATSTGVAMGYELAPGALVAGRFRIERLLGIGGMGVVYRAEDLSLGIPVAIKMLRPELAARPEAFDRFRQELLLSRQVSSPHVVRIHDIAQDNGRWFISMDAIDGEALDVLLDEHGAMPIDKALLITRQIAVGLAAAHAKGVIHRDLKPANILIDREGVAYISDFGIARSLVGGARTQTGAVVGTPEYLSPEQARAERVDARSDLYALGLLLYEMLSGQPAFSGGTQAEALVQRLVAPPPPIRSKRKEVPAWVERLVDRLLRPQPAHRLQTADAVIAAIDRKEVARDLHFGKAAWIGMAAAAVLAVGAAFVPWGQQSIVASLAPPPDRMVVLPIENATGEADLDPALAGVSEHVRQGLGALPEMVVVEGDRVAQAMAQLGISDEHVAEVSNEDVLGDLPARRVLRAKLDHINGGYRISATLSGPGRDKQEITTPTQPDLLAVAQAFTLQTAKALKPDTKTMPSVMAANPQALSEYGQGLVARRQGQLAPALDHFAKATAQDPLYGAAWLAQAQAAFLLARMDQVEQAAAQGMKTQPPDNLARPLSQLQAMAQGDVEAALVSQKMRVAAHSDDLDALLGLCFLQVLGGDAPEAVSNLRRLVMRDHNDPRAWFLLGKASIMQGDLREAVDEHLVRALVLFKRSGNAFGEAETVNALGVGFDRMGQTNQAVEQYQKAVELRRALGDQRGVASSLRNLARLATVQGKFQEAKAHLEQARALFVQIHDPAGLSAVDNELGLLAEEQGDFEGAMVAYTRGLEARRQDDDGLGVAQSLNNIGFTHYQLGDYVQARNTWTQALDGFEKLADTAGSVRVKQNLGLLDIAQGHWTQARVLLDDSLKTAEAKRMAEESAVSRRNLAELEFVSGNPKAALEQIDRAQASFAKRDDLRGVVDTELLRIQVLLAIEDLDGARKALVALRPKLAKTSFEQRAIAALQQAKLDAKEGNAKASVAAQAQTMAKASGVRLLVLQARLLGEDTPSAQDIQSMDNMTLRLAWQEKMLRKAIDRKQPQAWALYQDAAQTLQALPGATEAFGLHVLGMQAAGINQDEAGQAQARMRATDALRTLRGNMRQDWLTTFNQSATVRGFEQAAPRTP